MLDSLDVIPKELPIPPPMRPASAAALRTKRRGIFVSRHGERADYAYHKRGENWQSQARRPWDTPMTAGGHKQGEAMGAAAAAHAERLGLANIEWILCSPLLRCVETAAAAATALGVKTVSLEPDLCETMCEDWYRSWGVPGADSTWGGPRDCRRGVDVAEDALHPMALEPAAATHATAATIGALRGASLSPLGAAVAVEDAAYDPPRGERDEFDYRWGCFETDAQMNARYKGVLQRAHSSLPGTGSVLLVGHGGPTAGLYRAFAGGDKAGCCGYTALYAYVKDSDGLHFPSCWDAPLVADHAHLDTVPNAERGGRNDGAEQA
jgi:broad specificity phosphatase PhoE